MLYNLKEYQFDPNEAHDGRYPLTGETRGKGLLHHTDELKPFFSLILNEVRECLQVANIKTDMIIPYIMKSWFTIKDFNDSMTPHTHACSDLSFIYYVNPPDKSTITFYSENNPNCYSGGIFDTKPDPTRSFVGELNYINSGISSVMVNRGDLLVFPSNLKHGVAGTGGKGTNIRSIAGDIKLLLDPRFTDLDTGMIHFDHWRTF